VLRKNRKHAPVVRTIAATDGTTASVTVSGIKIDKKKPRLRVRTVAGKLRCTATDRTSGIRSCKIRKRQATTPAGVRVTWTATAVDRAGNRRVVKGSYVVR